jgi:DNA segregation ATPase FtsK/SpoIIIE-like protein
MLLGIKENMLIWDQNHSAGVSAIITPIQNEADWLPVPFQTTALTAGKLHSYIGESITGEAVVLDRGIYPHMLVSGMTGAGKTEAFCADIASMRASGLNPEIIIIDPKNTAQLKRQNPDFYTCDIDLGISKLESLFALAQERMDRYSAAGCDNYLEYQANVNKSERLIAVYIDELAAFLRKWIVKGIEKSSELPRHVRAFNILTTFLEQVRSSGVLLTAGVQTSKATNVPTDIRDNFGAKLIFASADDNAGRTAGESEAAALPMQGGFILKTGRKTTLGRGAYLKTI